VQSVVEAHFALSAKTWRAIPTAVSVYPFAVGSLLTSHL